jgi:DNA-binding response OmpR family regulator
MCAGDFGLADILPMPFDLEELLQKVSRVLDRGEPAEGRGLEHPATSSMAA